jgi:hypothetical protein
VHKTINVISGVSIMRFSRLVLLSLSVGIAAACENDKVTTPDTPSHSDIRWINAVADTGAVDIRFVDQIDLSPPGNNLAFRNTGSVSTAYNPAQSGSRHIRVFPTSLNINVTSQVLLDTTIVIPDGQRVTYILTGASRTAGALKLIQVTDDPTAPASGSINVRTVNLSGAPVNGYLVASTSDAIPGTATFSNVANNAASPYVTRAIGSAAVRFTDPGSTTVNASGAGPTAPTVLAGAYPGAGVNTAGTTFSVYYFPKARAGSVATPGAVWFVDRNPCDAGC